MPQPLEVEIIEEELRRVYRQAWDDILLQLNRAFLNPAAGRRRTRLAEVRRSIERELDKVDRHAKSWVEQRLPQIYRMGASRGATEAGAAFLDWAAIHTDAVQRLATDTFDDLLSATKYVRKDLKRVIRTAAKMAAELSVTTDRTAVQAGRELRRFLEQRGLHAIQYRNGARHGLDEYAQMVIRTKSAEAYNFGHLNGAQEAGAKYVEVFDGPDCGWTFHGDPQLASGMIVEVDEARGHPISHPNCRRSFGARPDIVTKPQAMRAQGGQVTSEQVAAQRAQDAQRLAQQRRRAQRRRAAARPPRPVRPVAKKAPAKKVVKPVTKQQVMARRAQRRGDAPTPKPPPPPAAGYTPGSNLGSSVFDGLSTTDAVGLNMQRREAGDQVLAHIYRRQGFDRLPDVVPDEQLDELIAAGDLELFRGMGTLPDGTSPADLLREGDYFPGWGIYGNGTYTAYGPEGLQVATSYAGGRGDVVRMALRPDANIVDSRDLTTLQRRWFDEQDEIVQGLIRQRIDIKDQTSAAAQAIDDELERIAMVRGLLADQGRFAASQGYDAIRVTSPGGSPADGYMVVLNRTAVAISRRNVT